MSAVIYVRQQKVRLFLCTEGLHWQHLFFACTSFFSSFRAGQRYFNMAHMCGDRGDYVRGASLNLFMYFCGINIWCLIVINLKNFKYVDRNVCKIFWRFGEYKNRQKVHIPSSGISYAVQPVLTDYVRSKIKPGLWPVLAYILPNGYLDTYKY